MQKKTSVGKNNNFAYDLEFGQAGEDWVKNLLGGSFRVEVKSDRMAAKTGNVFIEIFYKDKPSGISTTMADYWVYRIDDNDTAVIIPVKRLREIVRSHIRQHGYKHGGEYVKGALIPINQLLA
jgi:hypothetical protein